MHEMARWLVLDVGKSPLFTNGVDSEKTKRFRRKPYGDTGDGTCSYASLNELHAAAPAGGRTGRAGERTYVHLFVCVSPNTASVYYILNAAFALSVLCLPPGSRQRMYGPRTGHWSWGEQRAEPQRHRWY
jgi:hypothetical protein